MHLDIDLRQQIPRPARAILWGYWGPDRLAVWGPSVRGPPFFSAMLLYMAK